MKVSGMLVGIGVALNSVFAAPTVSDVSARQRYPWNGMVDIDYTITGSDTEDTAIAVKVTDTDTGKVYTPTNFLEVPPTVAGRRILLREKRKHETTRWIPRSVACGCCSTR